MKRERLMKLLTMILALGSLAIWLVSCGGGGEEEPVQPQDTTASATEDTKQATTVQLSAPTVELIGDTATWSANPDADKFEISIDGTLSYIENSVTSRKLSEGQTFKIRAVGDGLHLVVMRAEVAMLMMLRLSRLNQERLRQPAVKVVKQETVVAVATAVTLIKLQLLTVRKLALLMGMQLLSEAEVDLAKLVRLVLQGLVEIKVFTAPRVIVVNGQPVATMDKMATMVIKATLVPSSKSHKII